MPRLKPIEPPPVELVERIYRTWTVAVQRVKEAHRTDPGAEADMARVNGLLIDALAAHHGRIFTIDGQRVSLGRRFDGSRYVRVRSQ